ncbi:MAG: L-lactate permease [Actinomycetota bacterium]|nr:L-lactate permease [Actinomycetota bacterium]
MMDLLGIVISAMPFVVAAVGLAGLGWPASTAGGASLAVAVLGAVVWPDLEATAVPGALFAGLGTSAQVLYVLFGGLLLYNLLLAGGAVDAVSRFLGGLEPDRVALAAGIVVGVAPFFESVTGFGVAVVISVPILLAAGFTPLRAAVLASWGQCAVPWGALGVGTVIGAHLAGMGFGTLSDVSAFLSIPLFPVYGVAAVALAGGWMGVRRRVVEAMVLGLVAGVVTLVTSLYLVPELSGAVGGLAATAFFVARRRDRLAGVPVRALLPYAFLLALLAAANGIAALRSVLEELGPVFDGPGLPLLASGVFAALLLGLGGGEIGGATHRTATQWLPVAGAVLTFVLAGEVVAESGAAGLLAGGAEALGDFFPAVSPVLAALGGALTGSNAASNALFMPLQVEAARGLGFSEALTAAVQNVAGSHASMLAPQRMVLAATAAGLLGREGDILRTSVAPVGVSISLLALLGMLIR